MQPSGDLARELGGRGCEDMDMEENEESDETDGRRSEKK